MIDIISLINALAPVILVFMGFGIMFGIVRLRSVGFFLLFLLLLPFLASAITQSLKAGLSSGVSWKAWLVIIFIGLVALRLFIDRVFRR
jgi:hypothetical protein